MTRLIRGAACSLPAGAACPVTRRAYSGSSPMPGVSPAAGNVLGFTPAAALIVMWPSCRAASWQT